VGPIDTDGAHEVAGVEVAGVLWAPLGVGPAPRARMTL
jgi:hypothetical protein